MPEYGLDSFASVLRESSRSGGHLQLIVPVAQKDFLQSVFQFVPAMIAAPDWRLRAAALEAVGVVSLATKDVCALRCRVIVY